MQEKIIELNPRNINKYSRIYSVLLGVSMALVGIFTIYANNNEVDTSIYSIWIIIGMVSLIKGIIGINPFAIHLFIRFTENQIEAKVSRKKTIFPARHIKAIKLNGSNLSIDGDDISISWMTYSDIKALKAILCEFCTQHDISLN